MSANLFDDLPPLSEAQQSLAGSGGNLFDDITPPPPKPKREDKPATARDRAQAAIAGFNSGVAGLAGMVPDAFINGANLLNAGMGTAWHAATGKPIPEAIQPIEIDGEAVNPTSKLLAKMLDKYHELTPTTPDRPDDAASRLIATGTAVIPGAALGGGSIGGMVRNTAAALPAAEIGQFAAEHPQFDDSTEAGRAANTAAALAAQSVASEFGPAAATPLKRSLRAGASQSDIRQNIEDFTNATGQTPTWGQATGSQPVLGAEQLAGHGFGGQDPFEKLRDAQQKGASTGLQGLVDALGGVRGKEDLGDLIQNGIRGFQERTVNGRDPLTGLRNSTYGDLQAKADALIPSDLMVTPTVSIPAFRKAADPIADANAPANAALHSRTFAQRQADALAADSAAVIPTNNTPLAGSVMGVIPGTPGKPEGIAYPTFRQIRSNVGAAAFPDSPMNPLLSSPEQQSLRGGYDAMNKDLISALKNLPSAQAAESRADAYYGGAQSRLKQLARFTDTPTPEAAATQFTQAVRNQSTSTLRTLKKSLLPQERANVVGATIDDLGRATNSNQNADNNQFSFQTFMTHYAGLRPDVRDTIFSGFPQADDLRTSLDRLNRVSQNIAKGGKVMQSTSGTGPFNQASHELGEMAMAGGALATGHVGGAMGLMAMPGLRYITSRTMMTNPNFVNWLASSNTATPKAAVAHLGALDNLISRETDDRTRAELSQFRSTLGGQ